MDHLSIEKEPERQMPVLFIPALHSKWMLMANDIRENRKPTQEKSASLGFYCGLLAGQTSADYPSLTADLPKYTLDPYDAKFLATPRLLDPVFQVTVTNSGDTGRYQGPGSCFLCPDFHTRFSACGSAVRHGKGMQVFRIQSLLMKENKK